jgi:hypothetical protein
MVLLDRIVLKTSIYVKRAASLVIVLLLIGEVGVLEFTATVKAAGTSIQQHISLYFPTLFSRYTF